MLNKFCLTLAGVGFAALALAMPLQFDLTTMSLDTATAAAEGPGWLGAAITFPA